MASSFTGLNHAALYNKYRPKPCPMVITKILEFLKEKKKTQFLSAVDVACGSGQSTPVLGEYFESVLGCDISEAQVSEATKTNTAPNIKYCVADAEHIPVADNSVDLVTCSDAAHWFDFPAFCKEVDRVLKPFGCLVVYARLRNDQKILHEDDKIATKLDDLYTKFRYDRLKGYWEVPIEKHDNMYRHDFHINYPDCQRHVVEEHSDISLSGLLGYIETLSGYQKYHKEHPEDDILKDLQDKMLQTLSVDKSADDVILKTMCPILVLLGRKPEPNN
ncbi:putative methyltransferase DDB_G0268948 [Amphiura filiformis]|uniref:putative methyltransferase DDB_G0268948 n=1 Tax=Amphiura filiformis TaxID=82378 RepID=UPI003B222AEC